MQVWFPAIMQIASLLCHSLVRYGLRGASQ